VKLPRVSVIIPSYNLSKYIGEAIESVLNQTYSNLELIIVDDGSSDNSISIIKEYSLKDKRVKLYKFDENRGACEAFNYGVKRAKGEYICYIGADDIFYKDKVEMQVRFLEDNTRYVAVFGKPEYINENGEIIQGLNWNYINYNTRYEFLRHFFYYGNCLSHPSVMLKKFLYYELGFLDNRYYQLPDLDFWIKICKKYDIYVLNKVLYKNRIRGSENASGFNPYSYQRHWLEFAKILKSYTTIDSIEELYIIFPEIEENFGKIKDKKLIPILIGWLATKVNTLSHLFFSYDVFYEFFEDKKNIQKLKKINLSNKNFWFPDNNSLYQLFETRKELEETRKELEETRKEIFLILNSMKYKIIIRFEKLLKKIYLLNILKYFIHFYIKIKRYGFNLISKKILYYVRYRLKKQINVLSVINGIYPSIILGVDIPLKYLLKQNKINYISVFPENVNYLDIKISDIILFFRNVDDISFEIFNKSKELNKKIIYCIDDNFELIPDSHPIKGTINFEILKSFYKESDYLITYSEYFREKLKNYNRNIYYVSNLANIEMIENIKKRCNINKNRIQDKVIIGYLSSDPAHIIYFNIIKEAIRSILREYRNNVELHLINIKSEIMNEFDNVKYFEPIKSIQKFYEFMLNHQWDIGLAPLFDTEFNKCKTDNKYREYASLGICGIYSNVIPYASSVKNNLTGILVDNRKDLWYNAIKDLIENIDKRKMIIKNAYEDVKERYSLHKYADNYFYIFKKAMEE